MSYRSETILSGELSEDRDRKRNNRSNLILMSSHPHLQLTNKQNLNIKNRLFSLEHMSSSNLVSATRESEREWVQAK